MQSVPITNNICVLDLVTWYTRYTLFLIFLFNYVNYIVIITFLNLSTPLSYINETDHHGIPKILLKVVLSTHSSYFRLFIIQNDSILLFSLVIRFLYLVSHNSWQSCFRFHNIHNIFCFRFHWLVIPDPSRGLKTRIVNRCLTKYAVQLKTATSWNTWETGKMDLA